ncbi:pyridoxal-phosphate dependent enzyme [Vandammella animalimorsus]|uniref:L-serine ammonia-lyase n=1 Tax=Vandammella animalimorsus TaxID=2029117 RepID=A0A2A2ABI9_9BURK|nr:pyridoxal-phosphate dependent enzyme [Vandammella animalimorsus]PAT35147.1 hypothetical protein CK620_04325 [Vandammella animalimorsus]
MPLHIATPLLASPALSAAAGRDVWLKLEAVQPPGSFKIRGVGLPVTAVLPHTTSARARQAIAQYGAKVVVHGRVWDEARVLAQLQAWHADLHVSPR